MRKGLATDILTGPPAEDSKVNTSGLQPMLPVDLAGDPGYYFIFYLILSGNNRSVSSLRDYIRRENADLEPLIDIALDSLIKSETIVVIEDDIFDLHPGRINNYPASLRKLIPSLARVLVRSVIKRVDAGIRNHVVDSWSQIFAVPTNPKSAKKINQLTAKYVEDIKAVIKECDDPSAQPTEGFIAINLNQTLLTPGDL